jgi:flavin-dependent dehydrogenase
MTSEVDVAIVGARVAGSIAATLLGEAGIRVLLVDAAAFPSDTISTHFFRGAGLVGTLQHLDVLDQVLALGAPPLVRQYDYATGDPNPSIGGPQDPGDIGFALSVRRLSLDRILVDRARRTHNVEVLERTPVREVILDDRGRASGIVLQLADGPRSVRARLVVGADGRGSFVARSVGAAVERSQRATRAIYFRYLRDIAPPASSADGPEFSFRGDELAYAFPSDDGVTCLAISINLTAFEAFRAAPEDQFDAAVRAHPGLAPRYAKARVDSRILGTGPKAAGIRTPVGPGWALIGDASLHQDPWTGLGMDNAATQATLLAEAVIPWLNGDGEEREALGAYRRGRDESATPGFEFTAAAGRDLSAMS